MRNRVRTGGGGGHGFPRLLAAPDEDTVLVLVPRPGRVVRARWGDSALETLFPR